MMRRLFHTAIFALLAAAGCSGDIFSETEPRLAIDGFIEDGGFPVVIVTTTIPVTDRLMDEKEIRDCVARWAKVTVSDGENEVILTGKSDKDYFPSYIYTTGKLRGKAGRTYRLEAEYHGMKASAVTTIPDAPAISDIRVMKSEESGSQYYIQADFHCPEGLHCAFFIRQEGEERSFKPAYLGLVDHAAGSWAIYPPQLEKWAQMNPYFESGSTVDIKLCTMDDASYGYWESFAALSTFSSNVLVPYDDNLSSNVSGGEGLWAGYGTDVRKVTIP